MPASILLSELGGWWLGLMSSLYSHCSAKVASIRKGSLYLVSTGSSAFVQHYYVNSLINKVFTIAQHLACLEDALSSFVEDLHRLGSIEPLHKNVTGPIVSNAAMWNTLKLLPPEAVQKYYSEGINMILQCESFMQFHLVLDVEGMCSDLGIHHVVVNNYKRGVDAYQKFVLLSVPSVLIPNLAPLGKHVFNAYLPGTKPLKEWKNLYNLEDKVVFNGESNVMTQNDSEDKSEEKNNLVGLKGQVAGDAEIKEARKSCGERKANRIYEGFVI